MQLDPGFHFNLPYAPGCDRESFPVVDTGGSAGFPSHLQDVEFPFQLACMAITVCKRVANMLESDLEARVDMTADCVEDWSGGHREEFDTEWASQEQRLTTLKDDLRALVGRLQGAWDLAESWNNGRADARADFDPETDPQ